MNKKLTSFLRLSQLEKDDWVLVDADKQPGGLAGSFRTPEGFRFDHGYTVLPRRYDFIEHVLAELGPKYDAEGKLVKNREFIEFIEKVRTNWVSLRGHFVKFPIQSNLAGLPAKEQADCLADLVKAQILAKNVPAENPPNNLDDWLLEQWGETLTNLFFRPMMFKTWAHPTTKLAHNWVKSKIPPTDLKRDLVRTLDGEQKDDLWGHSSSFKVRLVSKKRWHSQIYSNFQSVSEKEWPRRSLENDCEEIAKKQR